MTVSREVVAIEQLIEEICNWKLKTGEQEIFPKEDLRRNNYFGAKIEKHPNYIESKRVFGTLDELLSSICSQKDKERHGFLFLLDVPGSGIQNKLFSSFKINSQTLNQGRRGS